MRLSVLFIFPILILSCQSLDRQQEFYIESKPAFYDLRHGKLTESSWIRDSKNLRSVHETLKKIGYRNLISQSLLTESPFIFQDVYINKPLKNILDGLIITYNQDSITEKYFHEFWQRRKREGNASVVYEITKEIKASLDYATPPVKDELVNDTLYNLAFIEYSKRPLTTANAIDNFNRLKKFGFHQSAYNLLYETYKYQSVNWNQDSLKKTLTSSKTYLPPWFEDDTK